MDMAKRNALITRMGELQPYNGGVAPTTIPLVSIEAYFDGAAGEAPLLCNSSVELTNDGITDRLKQISGRPDVQNCRSHACLEGGGSDLAFGWIRAGRHVWARGIRSRRRKR